MTGKLERTTCDACCRPGQRCEVTARGGIELRICLDWRSCIAATPPLDMMAGGVA